MASKRRVRILRGEKLLKALVITLLVVLPLSTVFSKAMLSKSNIELESIKKKITTQEKMNESLSMKINELASLDKVQKVASEQGLEYNNNNIKTVTE